jgi:DNA polymerase III subunit epsilon
LLKYAVVDVETSGFHPPLAEIVEIAVVHLDEQGQITGSWDTLIRPDGGVGATHVHGIDAVMVRDAPKFVDVAHQVHALLAGRVVAAHNLPFDSKFLISQLGAAGIAAPEIKTGVCTLSIAKRTIPGPPHKLADCCNHARIELRDAHKALGDATATARLLAYFMTIGINPVGTPVIERPLVPAARTPIDKLFSPR